MQMPILLPYPSIKPFNDVPTLKGVFCYVIEDYAPGYALTIKRENGECCAQLGGWDGAIIDSESHLYNIPTLLGIMKYAGISQLEFYFNSDNKLVDVRESINKFASPGMVRDLFGKCVGTQNVVEIAEMTEEKVKALESHGKNYIIKPSRYRYYILGAEVFPMYGRI